MTFICNCKPEDVVKIKRLTDYNLYFGEPKETPGFSKEENSHLVGVYDNG